MLAIFCWAWVLLLSVVCIPSEIPLEGTFYFLCKKLLNEDNFWVRDVGLCPLLLSMLGPHLAQTCTGVYAATVSVSTYVHYSCCVYKALFPRCLLFMLALIIFLPPLLHSSMNLEGKDLMGTSHLQLSVPRLLTLCDLSRMLPVKSDKQATIHITKDVKYRIKDERGRQYPRKRK